MNRWIDRTFEGAEPYMRWLAWFAIATFFVLVVVHWILDAQQTLR